MSQIIGYVFDGYAHCRRCTQSALTIGVLTAHAPELDSNGLPTEMSNHNGTDVTLVTRDQPEWVDESCSTCKLPLHEQATSLD